VGVADADDATRILTGMGDGDSTRILPTTAQLPTEQAVAEEEPPAKKKRSPWTWPLIALIALLVIALGGTLFGLLLNQGDKAPVKSSSMASVPSTPPQTPEDTTPPPVNVDDLNLVGMSCVAATALLEENDLKANCVTGDAATNEQQKDQVYEVSTGGNQAVGSTIDLLVYGDQVSIPAPQTAPSISGPVTEGQEATVSWNTYTCPSGTDPLSGYEVTLVNATFDGAKTVKSFTPGTGSEVITVDEASAGKTVTATYRAFCGERPSGMSGSGTSTSIQPAPEDPDDGIPAPPAD
ncbi:MAG: serine/threonine protein kinase, partial [Microbacterium sp.]